MNGGNAAIRQAGNGFFPLLMPARAILVGHDIAKIAQEFAGRRSLQ
jgi:hypothetical protein